MQPHWCAAGGADSGVVQRSPRRGDRTAHDRPGRGATRRDGPDQPTEQRRVCSAPTAFPNSNFADKPWANDYLRISEAQKFATGAGITVAVIDTGVNGSPRVPAEPGGDFVDQAGNGMSDCDSHGTLTASIIAGRPAPTDGFIGVAPDARILSLRQTSEAFQPVGSRTDPNDPNTTQTAGSLRSLARAVVHAANIGAQVINISEAACYKVTRPINESGLGAAINYAVNVKGAVIIVAAGNTGQDCTQNPPPDPAIPADPRGWKQVQTIVSPGVVLAAGADRRRHRPERAAEQLLDVRAVGGRRRPGGEHHRARLRRRTGQRPARPGRTDSDHRHLVRRRVCFRAWRRCSSSASPT